MTARPRDSVVLTRSGGLDTSAALAWTADVAGAGELRGTPPRTAGRRDQRVAT